MHWKLSHSVQYETAWLASLDYRSNKEVVFLAQYGNLDQGYSKDSIDNINHSFISLQRPALYKLDNYDMYYGSI